MKPKSIFHRSSGNRLTALATTAITLCLAGGLAQAGEYTSRYFRFQVTASNGGTGTLQTQMSEFNFMYKGKKLNIQAAGATAQSTGAGPFVTVTTTGGTNAVTAGEGANALFDGAVASKMFSNDLVTLTFDFGTPVTIDSYNFATANDFITRTPASWVFQTSADGANFTTIDTRTAQAPAFNGALFTYQGGFALADVAGAPVITSLSATTPAVIPAGGTVALTYATTGTPTSVILNPGAVDITATPSFTVAPTASTTYTITATNAAGTVTKNFDVRVISPTTATQRYVRFTPLQLRTAAANSIQISEFSFYNGETKLTGISATNPYGNNSGDGAPARLVDGSNTTKWLDFNKQGIIFDLGSSQTFDSYEMVTGNDATERDPVRWILEGSDDLTTWSTIQLVNSDDYPTPVGRQTSTGKIPVNSPPLVWTGALSANWNTTEANFSGPSTFSNNRGALFDGTSAVRAITATEQLAPTSITFSNDTGSDPYSLTGSPTYGSGSLIKNGTGTTTIDSLNALTGATIINKGFLVGTNPKSFGENNGTGNLIFRDGAQLGFTQTAQYTQRYWTVYDGGINVSGTGANPADAKLTHIGPMRLFGTFTKTGPGTLSMQGIGGSLTTATHNFVVSEGTMEFTSGYFNSFNFIGSKMLATVNSGAILRGTTGSALGGDYIDAAPGIGQLRISGTYEHTSGIQYLSNGLVTTNGVAQGRIVLKGGMISGGGQIESARSRGTTQDADATNNYRTVISTEASEISSQILGTGPLIANTGHYVFDVVNGPATDDLVIGKTIGGNFGIIKEGAGNLVLIGANTYIGRTYTDTIDDDNNAETPRVPLPPLPFDLPNGTTVRGGTLTLGNSSGSATGTSPVLMMSGTTLAGIGFTDSPVTIQGTVAPGDIALALPGEAPIGALTVGSATISGTYISEINGFDADQLVVNGDLNISGSLSIVEDGLGVTEESYVIATYTGTRTGSFSTGALPAGYSVVYDESVTPHQVLLTSGAVTTGYDAFIGGTTLTGDDALPTADPDGDGLTNLVEFVIGADPEASSRAEAPTMSVNANGDFVFVFRRTSESAYLEPTVEYSTSLTGEWTPAPEANAVVVPDGFGAGVDSVTVTLPASFSASGKLFARLTVTK